MINKSELTNPILYSCYTSYSKDGEQFMPDHVLSYQIDGTLIINDGRSIQTYKKGDLIFCRRNSLIKAIKQPPEDGEFKALTLFIDQDTLRNYCREFEYHTDKLKNPEVIIKIENNDFYKTYMESMIPYSEFPFKGNETMLALKIREAIMLILKNNPELKDYLFDFSEPGKINLEEFMTMNYKFNVDMSKFAYLTGRSLATFKRDFEKTFNTTPGKWLQKTRLEEAYYLIKEKKKKPSDVYLEVGFETISHFSYSFKQFFGVNPSSL